MSLLGLLAVLLVGPARAQQLSPEIRSTLSLTGSSSPASVRLMGMGGASLAGLADYSALFTNPAGLGYYSQSEVGGAFTALNVGDEATYGGNLVQQDIRDYGIGSFSYVHKVPTVRGSLVFGAAYQQRQVYDRQREFAGDATLTSISELYLPISGDVSDISIADPGEDGIYATEDDAYSITFENPFAEALYWGGGLLLDVDALSYDDETGVSWQQTPFVWNVGEVRPSGTVTEDGTMREVSFGGAVEAAQRVMIGASANLVFGAYEAISVYSEQDVDPVNPLFDRLEVTDTFDSDLFGVNARAGLSAELVPGVQLGLSLESPTFYSVKEEYSTELYVRADDDLDEVAGEGLTESEYSITTPWRLGGGLAYRSPNLTLSADAEFVDWTQLDFDSDINEESRQYFSTLGDSTREHLDYVFNLRAGGEVQLGALALRGGFAYQPDPRKRLVQQSDGTELDQSRTLLSAGIGYRFTEQMQLDVAWVQERYDDQYRPFTGMIYTDAGISGAPIVDEEVVRNRFAVGLRFSF